MLTLGIDPGISATGYGLVKGESEGLLLVDWGVITPDQTLPLPLKLERLYEEVKGLIDHHHPSDMAVERLFFSRNVRTAFTVGQARGVVILAAAQAGLPFYEYTPLEVKESVVGYGRATKDQVQEMVGVILGLDSIPQPDHAADALAIAICHRYSIQMGRALETTEG